MHPDQRIDIAIRRPQMSMKRKRTRDAARHFDVILVQSRVIGPRSCGLPKAKSGGPFSRAGLDWASRLHLLSRTRRLLGLVSRSRGVSRQRLCRAVVGRDGRTGGLGRALRAALCVVEGRIVVLFWVWRQGLPRPLGNGEGSIYAFL